MNKQQALEQLQDLVDNGFAFYVGQDKGLAHQADEILYRLYALIPFNIYEAQGGGYFDDGRCRICKRYARYDYYGVSSKYGTFFADGEFDGCGYGENSEEVTLEGIEMLLEILGKEEFVHPEIADSVRGVVRNRVDTKVGIEISLSQVPVTLSPSQAKVLADSIYATLEQFTSPLSVGDIVSDNDQSLVVYGIDNDKIWCKNEQSGKYFTHSREQLIKMEKN